MRSGHLESDLRSGVARSNHQNGAFLELRRAAVLARMDLHDARKELAGEGGDLRDLIGARRDDHAFRFEMAVAGCNYEPIPPPWRVRPPRHRFERGDRIAPRRPRDSRPSRPWWGTR